MSHGRVLLAEDDRFLRKAAAVVLRRHGYDVVTAEDGEQALRAVESGRPDIVLLDLIMPRLQGFEVLKALKGKPETAGIPVIILSNLSHEHDRGNLMAQGAAAYLVKANVSLEDLAGVVDRVLGEQS